VKKLRKQRQWCSSIGVHQRALSSGSIVTVWTREDAAEVALCRMLPLWGCTS